jgi:GxxExxY protein
MESAAKKMKAEQDYESLTAIARDVFAILGAGFMENVFHRAFVHELNLAGISYESEKIIPVMYKEVQIGYVRCDLLVQKRILVEFKAVQTVMAQHLLQLERYATHLNIKEMILVNFPLHKNREIETHVFIDGAFHKM